ncbi:PH domain-containing protein [Gelidibacter maritimus]|uniref:PH domain-containing protein n=1 Tax=Gelidibacter maritimus TaxID=2761487 RepID=A0A7W2M7K0_9FLAO|nr:PH domain-containing protein [Gelidibacter maritimus]MBA6154179.1 PH domain-containing protein [Gelidibacter maritimus]
MFSNQQINLDTLPSIADVDLKPISKQYLKIIIFNRLVFYGIIGFVLFIAKIKVSHPNFQLIFWYLFSAVLLFCILNLMGAIFAFKKRKYAIRTHDVIYSKGLLVNSISVIPVSRIQHLEISRSWLARRFNLGTLKIYTAGDSGIDLRIPGLKYVEAKQINDFLSSKINGAD